MSALVLGLLAIVAMYQGLHAFMSVDNYEGGRWYAVMALGWAIYLLGLRALATVLGFIMYGER